MYVSLVLTLIQKPRWKAQIHVIQQISEAEG